MFLKYNKYVIISVLIPVTLWKSYCVCKVKMSPLYLERKRVLFHSAVRVALLQQHITDKPPGSAYFLQTSARFWKETPEG